MGNCLIFAIRMWWKHDGYVAIRKSRYGWWPHFIWIEDLKDAKIQQFVPLERKLHIKYVDKIFFKGHVIYHDVPQSNVIPDLELQHKNRQGESETSC